MEKNACVVSFTDIDDLIAFLFGWLVWVFYAKDYVTETFQQRPLLF